MANHVILFSAWFQHTAARRRLGRRMVARACRAEFQHTAARRRLGEWDSYHLPTPSFNTQPPEGGWIRDGARDKAVPQFQHTAARRRLAGIFFAPPKIMEFQHTAARRRLAVLLRPGIAHQPVSTHSRPKAAGPAQIHLIKSRKFQHTAARRRLEVYANVEVEIELVSTHSRPKAAGCCPLSATAP